MKIKDNFLFNAQDEQVAYQETPNQGGIISPIYLIIHYTAGVDGDTAVRWFSSSNSSASAHVVIGRDGKITQLVPFNKKAWHAGRSTWHDLSNLNNHSIGIELANAGFLVKRNGKWFSIIDHQEIPDDEVIEAKHKNKDEIQGWQVYTQAQLEAAIHLSIQILNNYSSIIDILGHDDISPGRKFDPGPAFPMESFKAKVMGRRDEEELIYETTGVLNIRSGPGVEYSKLAEGPLPKGTKVGIIQYKSHWRYVEVLDAVPSEGYGLAGWVSGNYLKRTS